MFPTTRSALATGAAVLPDSIFTWVFEAASGNSWGGWLVEDSVDLAVGDVLATVHGRYVVTGESESGADLSAFGLEDGEVRVEWYRDGATGDFLVTRAGAGVPVGMQGLGTEVDAAWTSAGWVSFGRGGAVQVSVQSTARFTWVFEARGGDRLHGTLIGDATAYVPGDTVATSFGLYRITAEEALSPDDAAEAMAGQVRTTRYYDSGLRRDLSVESAGAAVTGAHGLGSELDRVWTGSAWAQVGLGGSLQADGAFAVYLWRFDATSGDRYEGSMFANALAYEAGQEIATAAGRYTVTSEEFWGTAEVVPDGTIYVKRYFDAASNLWLDGYRYAVERRPSEGRFLGNEEDSVWDGDSLDRVGRGGALQADVEQYSVYLWRFDATSGDRYEGSMFANALAYEAGQVITTTHGHYTVTSEEFWGTAEVVPDGTIYVKRYFDAVSNLWLDGYRYAVERRPSEGRFLGNEEDSVWDGDSLDRVGLGGSLQAEAERFAVYLWRFDATSGDRYEGSMFANALAYEAGQEIATVAGRYTVTSEEFWGTAEVVPDGTIYVKRYFDAASNLWLDGYRYAVERRPSEGRFLGNEEDSVWDGDSLDRVGRGGALQADVEQYSVYLWRFEATSGDRYEGSMFANALAYEAGQVITTAHGHYTVTSEEFWGTAEVVPDGTIYVKRYFDAASNLWLDGYRYAVERRPSEGRFLGNEEDSVWDGDSLDRVGLGGSLQADVELLG